MATEKIVFVLGMHRSGTSAITRGLTTMGVELGDNLMSPKAGVNDKGFWEDIDFNKLNIDLLSALGLDWDSFSPVSSEDVEKLCSEGYKERALELLCSKFGRFQVVGFKDPRMAKLQPFWKVVLQELPMEVNYVIALRNPISVAESLAARNGFSIEKGCVLWLEHTLTLLFETSRDKRILIHYDTMVDFPDIEMKRLSSFLDMEIDPVEFGEYKRNFLDGDLRNTNFSGAEVAQWRACPALAKDVYISLLQCALDREDISDECFQLQVDSWSNEFMRLTPIMNLMDGFERKIGSQVVQIAERDAMLAERDTMLAERDTMLAERDAMLAERDAMLAERDTMLAERDTMLAERDAMLAKRDALISKQEFELEDLEQRFEIIVTSRSWRITVPARFVVSLFRR